MSQNIKNNLFRFVTLRSPQLIDKKEEHPGFVYHPNEAADAFLIAIEGEVESNKKNVLQETADGFVNPLKTIAEVKALNPELYQFSSWLMRNKNALSYKETKDNFEGVDDLGTTSLKEVWENLIYQTITKDSTYVREALIRLLVTNQFLVAFKVFSDGLTEDVVFTVDQGKEFVRRANASVVMPKALFSSVSITKTKKAAVVTESQKKAVDDAFSVALAKNKIEAYKYLVDELKQEEVVYNKASQKAYKVALNLHNTDVKTKIDEATPVIVEEIDPITKHVSKIKTYPGLVLPKFSLPEENPINKTYLSGKISTESLKTLEDNGLDVYDTFSEVFAGVKLKIKKENQIILSKTRKLAKKVKIGGTTLSVSNKVDVPNKDYCFTVNITNAGYEKKSLVMHLGVDYTQASIVSSSYQLTLNSDTSVNYSDDSTRKVYGGGPSDHLGLILFNDGLILASGIYSLVGQFTLNNGDTIEFTVDNFSINERGAKTVSGCASVIGGESNSQSIVASEVYGITNLGIADFRRVEQEVCCYVPGEVSHIENVMAREYKERSTRSLTSVETTTEDSRESEVENLTDSTTTERNEMQSEVASVLNEDESQSYGANTSINSRLGRTTFNIGASFNAASASSSSNSNSQAQTYAQEVTERAMERIVQKVSSKRTSRILKEFEENNSHGFDNRKGTEHVTGVYRWVDKIYKNKLINYGKRLMYEFAIPEPSKFFKEAIFKQIENDEFDKELIVPEKPLHPSEYGLNSAISLDILAPNFVDYREVAAHYNAEVSESPKEFIAVSESFKVDFLDHDQEGNSVNGVVKIPEAYQATGFRVAGSMFHHGDDDHAKIGISVGYEPLPVYYSSTTNDIIETVDTVPLDNAIGDLAVSASSYDTLTASFNVFVDCKITDESLSQWQNETYNAIMEAYQDRVNEYNDAKNQEVIQAQDREKLKFNPLQNREIEKRELKRIAIELLTEQKGKDISRNNYDDLDEDTGVSKVNIGTDLQKHISEVKFFEQAFDWEIMAYMFYPYFYADEGDWKGLFQQQDAADPLFQAFLQSGMARTVVPVRPEFKDAVNWYMTTGEIWNGEGLIPEQDDDLYVSVAEEMQTVQGAIEGTWETRLPTSLTVLQAGSIGLDVKGLPCDTDCSDFKLLFDSDGNPELNEDGTQKTDNPITQINTLIGGNGGVGSDAVSGTITVQ